MTSDNPLGYPESNDEVNQAIERYMENLVSEESIQLLKDTGLRVPTLHNLMYLTEKVYREDNPEKSLFDTEWNRASLTEIRSKDINNALQKYGELREKWVDFGETHYIVTGYEPENTASNNVPVEEYVDDTVEALEDYNVVSNRMLSDRDLKDFINRRFEPLDSVQLGEAVDI
ncbi:MAG: hypothetical protein BRC29_01930 [Nanohaloarchaea archaeon SW_7_43_1]|nr:MAG: hypothetical protein BRC29_01930 [Nanohaloarchaea archaeon SW_7_43_1]